MKIQYYVTKKYPKRNIPYISQAFYNKTPCVQLQILPQPCQFCTIPDGVDGDIFQVCLRVSGPLEGQLEWSGVRIIRKAGTCQGE